MGATLGKAGITMNDLDSEEKTGHKCFPQLFAMNFLLLLWNFDLLLSIVDFSNNTIH
jgi:hypothetical protein